MLSGLAVPAAASADGAQHSTQRVSFTGGLCGGEPVAWDGVMRLTDQFVTLPEGGYRRRSTSRASAW